jgi:hypothetical protein
LSLGKLRSKVVIFGEQARNLRFYRIEKSIDLIHVVAGTHTYRGELLGVNIRRSHGHG